LTLFVNHQDNIFIVFKEYDQTAKMDSSVHDNRKLFVRPVWNQLY